MEPMSPAFRRMLDQHYRANFNTFVKRYTAATKNHHDAEDIVQNAYVEACEYWKSIDDLDSWMEGVLRRCFKNHLRDKITRGAVQVSMEEIHEEPSEDLFTDDWVVVRDAITKMGEEPPGRKRLLGMYFLERMTQPEIASAMGVTVKTVENTVRRFRQEL